MLIKIIDNREHLSDHVRRRGIRPVARVGGFDVGFLSRIINNKVVISEEICSRIIQACNKVKPNKELWDMYYSSGYHTKRKT